MIFNGLSATESMSSEAAADARKARSDSGAYVKPVIVFVVRPVSDRIIKQRSCGGRAEGAAGFWSLSRRKLESVRNRQKPDILLSGGQVPEKTARRFHTIWKDMEIIIYA